MDTTCKHVVDLLMAFLEGDLPPEQAEALKGHLASCPPCIDFLATYKKTPDVCRRSLEQSMPSELAERLTAFLRQRIPTKK